uniref:Uncharacterized protein n=1 Tax=Physcomitrium patens TaxID=3218 RepID=A0A2K1KJN9_PHYPA|nr:hypothetical protein PHYPA_007649 [Physcomitrium patens]
MGRIGVSQSPPPFVTKFRDASFGAAFRPDAADSKRGDAPREVTRAHGVSGSPKRRHGKPCKEDAPNDLDCGDEKRRSVRQRDESGGPGRDRSRVWQPAPHPILADSLAQIFFWLFVCVCFLVASLESEPSSPCHSSPLKRYPPRLLRPGGTS